MCDLNVSIAGITGDCFNTDSGAFTISINGTAPDYTVDWINPPYGTIPLGPGVVGYTIDNLSAGTYTFDIIDSCLPDNNYQTINVNVSSGTCVSLTGVENTSCGLNNGSLTATTTTQYNTAKFYLYDTTIGYITSATSLNNFYVFDNLGAGTYYVVGDDGGGCTGKSETCIIMNSNELSVGLFIVNASSCAPNTGAIYVTGVTGTPPYTYSWSPGGQTTNSITGLTVGNYILTVTDSEGCIQSSGITITAKPPVGLVDISFVNPTCFASDGEVSLIVSGGTAPFQYVGSNGHIDTTFSNTNTFYNIPAGPFTVVVKDAGNCSFTATTTLLTPGGLNVTSVNVTNSTCSGNGGKIDVNIFGGSPPYTYTLTDSLSNNTVVNGNFTSWSFNGLSSGSYILTISDSGPCDFVGTYIVNNNELFELTVETTGTTCNQEDGSVLLSITPGGTPPFHYEIDGYSDFSNNLEFLYENLPSGNYVATVTDANYCQQELPFTIVGSSTVDFLLIGTDSLNGSNGTISALITNGTPPFTLTWSPNVNGQTGTEIDTLSAGTYTLTVVDNNGCSKTRTITINGFNKLSSYQVYNICDEDFFNTGQTGRKGPQEMLTEGFHDLTSGDTNCILNRAIFTVKTIINGDLKEQSFYTGATLSDFPSDNEFYDVVESLLLTYNIIGEIVIDAVKNTLTIESVCDVTIETLDATVKVELDISYDISCETCETQTPTPTPTATPTPTPTPTISVSACTVIYVVENNDIYAYDLSSNVSTLLPVPSNVSNVDIAHTDSKLWVNNNFMVREWDITLSPFSATFNRDITFPFTVGNGLGVIDNQTLITTNESSPQSVYEMDITTTTAVDTFKFNLPPTHLVAGDIMLTTTNKLLVTTAESPNIYLLQYDYLTGVLELTITLNPTVGGGPWGIFEEFGNIYITDSLGRIYNVDTSSPYNITLINSTGNLIYGASQSPVCLTTDFTTPTPTPSITPTLT